MGENSATFNSDCFIRSHGGAGIIKAGTLMRMRGEHASVQISG